MPNGKLTRTEAEKSWVLKAAGVKLRDIHSRFDVDPRRLYEVWEGKVHLGSSQRGRKIYERLFKEQAEAALFAKHVPKLRVNRRPPDINEPRLPF